MGSTGVGEASCPEEELLDYGGSSEEGSLVDGAPRDEVSLPRPSSWAPSAVAFRSFENMASYTSDNALRSQQKESSLIQKLTINIRETFRFCNPSFSYEALNPRCQIPLTKPSQGVSNEGLDNSNSDLILTVNGILVNAEARRRYKITEMLGQGTFGQVAKCWKDDTEEFVAVKVIKNQPAYYHQALVEISILRMLNTKYDVDDRHHIVRIVDHFVFEHHLCIVFELLTYNLFELIKQNQFRGLSINLVRLFTKQLLDSLTILQDANVIHCDLKPENILLKSMGGEIKLIDFGSACLESRTVYSYIQSRFYRSPEVLLGHAYTTSIDMWSLGCVAAELFLGLPLFPGASEYDLMQRMLETLDCQPPDHILRHAKQTSRFFKRKPGNQSNGQGIYTFLTAAEFEEKEKAKPAAGKRYFKHTRLEDIVISYSLRKGITPDEVQREKEARLSFIHFLRGLVDFDPVRRWSPRQAAEHPFITEEPFTGHWEPPPDSRKPAPGLVRDGLKSEWSESTLTSQGGKAAAADHCGTSLDQPQLHSQQQHNTLRHLQQQQQQQQQQQLFNSPHFSNVPQFSPYGISYGTSYGSYGSYGEGTGSYGSYNTDASANFYNYATPPAANSFNAAMAAASAHGGMMGLPGGVPATPPTRGRLVSMMSSTPQMMGGLLGAQGGPANHGPGLNQLGMSPSMNTSGLRPTSLGMSPSQYTPPSNQFHYPSGGSPKSPVRYGGPTSPLRGPAGPPQGGVPGPLALGKAAAVGQYNKRRGRSSAVHPDGSGGSLAGAMEFAAAQARQQMQHQQPSWLPVANGDPSADALGWSYEGQSQAAFAQGSTGRRSGGPAPAQRRARLTLSAEATNGGHTPSQHLPAGESSQWGAGSGHGTHASSGAGNESPSEAPDETSPPLPDPGDWDPGYSSDELLFEDDGSPGDSGQSSGQGTGHGLSGSHQGDAQDLARQPQAMATIGSPTTTDWQRSKPAVPPPGAAYGASPPSMPPAYSYSLGPGLVPNGMPYGASQHPPAALNGRPSSSSSSPFQTRHSNPHLHPPPYQQQQQHQLQPQQLVSQGGPQMQQLHQQQYYSQQLQLQHEQRQALLHQQQQQQQQQQHTYSQWGAQGGGLGVGLGLGPGAGHSHQLPPGRDSNLAEGGSTGGLIAGYGNRTPTGQLAGPYKTSSGSLYGHSPSVSGGSGEYGGVVNGRGQGAGSGEWSSAPSMSPPGYGMGDGIAAWQGLTDQGAIGHSPDMRSSALRRPASPANNGRFLPPAAPFRRDNRRAT